MGSVMSKKRRHAQHGGRFKEAAVQIDESLGEHQKGQGEGVEEAAHNDAERPVDGELNAREPGDDAHFAKEVDNDKAVRDGGHQHGQDCQEPEQGAPLGRHLELHNIGEEEGHADGKQAGHHRDHTGIAQRLLGDGASQHLGKAGVEGGKVHRFSQQGEHGHDEVGADNQDQ